MKKIAKVLTFGASLVSVLAFAYFIYVIISVFLFPNNDHFSPEFLLLIYSALISGFFAFLAGSYSYDLKKNSTFYKSVLLINAIIISVFALILLFVLVALGLSAMGIIGN